MPDRRLVPTVGLMEIGLRQRSGNGIVFVVSLSYKTGLKQQKGLNISIRIHL
jgi:hypothetical protein